MRSVERTIYQRLGPQTVGAGRTVAHQHPHVVLARRQVEVAEELEAAAAQHRRHLLEVEAQALGEEVLDATRGIDGIGVDLGFAMEVRRQHDQ